MDYRLEQLRFELREDPSSRIFFKLGDYLRREGEFQEAIAVLGNGLEQHPKYVAAWVSLGRALLDAGSTRQAADALGRALALDPENAVASRHAGEAAIANGEWVEAIKALKRARALSAPDETLDERIQFVEGHLDEIGQLEAPPPTAKVGSGWVSPPSTGRSLDQVFAESEEESPSDSTGDDVFAVGNEDEPVSEDEAPEAYDSRATMAIPLAEMFPPSSEAEAPTEAPIEISIEPEPAPTFESVTEIEIDEVIETQGGDDEVSESDIAFAIDDDLAAATPPPGAIQSETVFAEEDEPDTGVNAAIEMVADSDVESDTVPLSVPEPESDAAVDSEVHFEFDLQDDVEVDVRSEELPLPTMTLARLALDQGDLELAEQTLRGVLERDPNSTEANELLAGLRAGAGVDTPESQGTDEPGDSRAQALRRWLDAVRLASERLKP